jgi:hypothetical protein
MTTTTTLTRLACAPAPSPTPRPRVSQTSPPLARLAGLEIRKSLSTRSGLWVAGAAAFAPAGALAVLAVLAAVGERPESVRDRRNGRAGACHLPVCGSEHARCGCARRHARFRVDRGGCPGGAGQQLRHDPRNPAAAGQRAAGYRRQDRPVHAMMNLATSQHTATSAAVVTGWVVLTTAAGAAVTRRKALARSPTPAATAPGRWCVHRSLTFTLRPAAPSPRPPGRRTARHRHPPPRCHRAAHAPAPTPAGRRPGPTRRP